MRDKQILRENLLAILAQWATKLKVLSHRPAYYASMSLDQGEDVLLQHLENMQSTSLTFVRIRMASDNSKNQDVDALDEETDITSRYYREATFFRADIECLLKVALDGLQNKADSPESTLSSFEICTLVFQAGLDGLPTTLSESRQGSIDASTDAVRVNCTYTTMELVLANINTMKTSSGSVSGGNPKRDSNAAIIDWEWVTCMKQECHQRDQVAVGEMDNLISVLVPLALTSTVTSVKIDKLMAVATSGTAEDDPIVQFESPPEAFEAHFTLSSAQYLKKQKDATAARLQDPDVCSVSKNSSRLGVQGKYTDSFRLTAC